MVYLRVDSYISQIFRCSQKSASTSFSSVMEALFGGNISLTNFVDVNFQPWQRCRYVYSRSPLSRIPDSCRERMQESTNSKPVVSSSSISFCPSAVKKEKRMSHTKREKMAAEGRKPILEATSPHLGARSIKPGTWCNTRVLNGRWDWLKSILVTAEWLNLVLHVIVCCKCLSM